MQRTPYPPLGGVEADRPAPAPPPVAASGFSGASREGAIAQLAEGATSGSPTFRALRTVAAGVGIVQVSNIVNLFAAVLLLVALVTTIGAINQRDVSGLGASERFAFAGSLLGLGGMLVAAAGAVVGLVGLGKLSVGRWEFGQGHQSSVNEAWYAASAAVGLGMLSALAGIWWGSLLLPSSARADDFSRFAWLVGFAVPVQNMLMIGAIVCSAISMRLAVAQLVRGRGRRDLGAFGILASSGAAILVAVTILLPFSANGAPSPNDPPALILRYLGSVFGALAFYALLLIVSTGLFIASLHYYGEALEDAAKRVKRTLERRLQEDQPSAADGLL